MVLELVAASVLLIPDVSRIWGIVAVVVAVAIALAVLAPVRGVRIGTWVVTVLGYAGRRRVTSVLNPVGGAVVGDGVVVPAEVLAFFPGLSVRTCETREGEQLGLLQWQGKWHATLRVTADTADLLATTGSSRLPVERILTSLSGQDLGLDAVRIVTQSLGGDPRRFADAAIGRVANELGVGIQLVREREVFVSVQIDPIAAAAAIAARGGDSVGLDRLACAAVSRIRSEVLGAGLSPRVLDAGSALRAMATSLLQPPAAEGMPVRWIESWRGIASAQVHHRCFVIRSWSPAGLDGLDAIAAYGLSVAHEVRTETSDGLRVTSVIRLSALTARRLDEASADLRSACHTAGIGIRLLRGHQAAGLRMTIPGGQN